MHSLKTGFKRPVNHMGHITAKKLQEEDEEDGDGAKRKQREEEKGGELAHAIVNFSFRALKCVRVIFGE